jgi:phosphoglycolate phosphatase-like HAD superfamily hydrolase
MTAFSLENVNVALDSDSVILQFYPAFCEAFAEALGRPPVVAKEVFDLRERFGLSEEENNVVWRHFEATRRWSNLEPMPGAERAIKKLRRAKANLHVVSGIPQRLRAARLENFSHFNFVPDTLQCVGSGRASKEAALRLVAPKAYGEDRVEHLHAAQFIPHLALLTGEAPAEQYPVPGARVDCLADGIEPWVDALIEHPEWLFAPRSAPIDLRSLIAAPAAAPAPRPRAR